MADEGTRSIQQIQAEGPNHEIRNVKTDADGNVMVAVASGGGAGAPETTLFANVMELTTDEKTVGVNAEVTSISVANYSETASVTVTAGDSNTFVVGPNIATDLPINATVDNVGFTSTEAGSKVQYVIKGVK